MGRVSPLVAAVQGIKALAAKIPGFQLGSFAANPQLAQAKALLAAQKQNAIKTQLQARAPKPVLPEALQADLAEVARYRASLAALESDARGQVDEFGDALG